ncbi:unnamed protein product [Ceratitis capitata]|uniref:(Mediterranean fruit fly) hypothetical protein n=1 Tax=Ceratitis capitata TaxID=7213 RepID=A0A811UYC3_CERCA|nr:unnamed protein product [Ceratitis capitata]
MPGIIKRHIGTPPPLPHSLSRSESHSFRSTIIGSASFANDARTSHERRIEFPQLKRQREHDSQLPIATFRQYLLLWASHFSCHSAVEEPAPIATSSRRPPQRKHQRNSAQ